MPENAWSDWLDFSPDVIEKSPESEGVFMLHEAMKILFIGGSVNIRVALTEKRSEPCISKATRFRFMTITPFSKKSEELVSEYRSRHRGELPGCM